MQFLGLGDGSGHAAGSGCQHQFGAQDPQQVTAFQAHAFGHAEDAAVTFGRRHEGQGDAGIARSWFNDGAAGVQQTVSFGGLDHGLADAVFHAVEGIAGLQLHVNVGQAAHCHMVQFDQGGVPHGFHDVLVSGHLLTP